MNQALAYRTSYLQIRGTSWYSSLFASCLSSGFPFEQLRRDQRGSNNILPSVHQLPHIKAEKQYGNRKDKAAIEQCLNKRLTFDLARQLKRPLAMCSIDAKSCYDRILYYVASLYMRRDH
jgi:hypothetical protein